MEQTVEAFHSARKPFYIDAETLLIKFPTSRHINCSHAQWFTEIGMPFVHCVRGYYKKTEDEEFIMIYWNDFEIPNINASLIPYLFEYFPNIDYVGLGCDKGKPGEVWKPKFKIVRG